SSCVLRSGARNESIWLIHAFCASCNAGKTSCSGPSNGKLQSSWCVMSSVRSLESRGYEHGNRDLVRLLAKRDAQRHPDLQLVGLAVDNVGHHAGALSKVDDRRDVRHTLVERWKIVHVHHRPRVERGVTARLLPRHVVAPAARAERPRVEVRLAARAAALD